MHQEHFSPRNEFQTAQFVSAKKKILRGCTCHNLMEIYPVNVSHNMKSSSHHPAPKAPVALGSLVVGAMAWNAAAVQVSPARVVISGSVRTEVIALENIPSPNIHAHSTTTRRFKT